MEKSETIFFPVFSQNFILNIIHILLSNKNAQIQKIMLTPLRYTPSDTKIIKNKVLPQKMWICGKIYFERFFNYFPFWYENILKQMYLKPIQILVLIFYYFEVLAIQVWISIVLTTCIKNYICYGAKYGITFLVCICRNYQLL